MVADGLQVHTPKVPKAPNRWESAHPWRRGGRSAARQRIKFGHNQVRAPDCQQLSATIHHVALRRITAPRASTPLSRADVVPEKAAQGLVKGCGWHGMQVGQGSLERPNQVWAIDFQFDQTSDREATEYLRMDNGPELIAWRCATGAGWRAPGPATLSRTPWENPMWSRERGYWHHSRRRRGAGHRVTLDPAQVTFGLQQSRACPLPLASPDAGVAENLRANGGGQAA
jgi:hypothetical protein